MGFPYWISLFSECFKLAGWSGIRACFRFMTGDLVIDETIPKSYNFPVGGSNA